MMTLQIYGKIKAMFTNQSGFSMILTSQNSNIPWGFRGHQFGGPPLGRLNLPESHINYRFLMVLNPRLPRMVLAKICRDLLYLEVNDPNFLY
jgi:hypothetical protein